MDYPSDPSVGLVGGKFTDGDPLNTIPASLDRAEDMNRVYDSLIYVLTKFGVTPDEDDTTLVAKAIENAMAGANIIARFTTTGNIDLNGLATQAGGDWSGALTAGDLIFVKDQSTGSQNGWYAAAAGAWTRVVYLDESTEIKAGNLTKVSEGVTHADSMWMLETDGEITVGVTAMVFVQKDIENATTLLTRIATATFQAITGSSTSESIYTPLSYSFVGDGSLYLIKVKLVSNHNSTAATGDNRFVYNLYANGVMVDRSSINITTDIWFGQSVTLSYAAVISGSVDLTVGFRKSSTVGSVAINGDRDNNTDNTEAQLSTLEIIKVS